MKKPIKIIVLLLFTFSFYLSFAQLPGRISIQGIVADSIGEPLPYSTVMLLNPSDSTLLNFTTTNMEGFFIFSSVRNHHYLLKTSHISYIPFQLSVQPSETATNNLGVLNMQPISKLLMEVVIRAARAPIYIKGDTIEYDATTFKVPPGSSVEDLLRRLPGIEVDATGNVSSMGENVRRVFVDGKTFFGEDPKSATKNLDAQAISRVQVFDYKSESARLTGVDDGIKDKAMNLELKEEFKKGSFGKASLAAGTEDRWAGRGSFNRFDKKNQLSFIGYANNINQTGVNWEDYGEFRGQAAFGQFDNGDFGFSAGRRNYYRIGGDIPINYFDGRGFTENYGGGINYNYSDKKTQFNSSYFYNQTDLFFEQFSERQTFLDDFSFFRKDTINNKDFRSSHSLTGRAEINFDSSNTLIVRADLRLRMGENFRKLNQWYFDEKHTYINNAISDNSSNNTAAGMSSTAIYAHKFKKDGRAFALSGALNLSNNERESYIDNINRFISATNLNEQLKYLKGEISESSQYKSSMMYSEPIAKRWSTEAFYNFVYSHNKADNIAQTPEDLKTIDSLSVRYNHNTLYNRLGLNLRYSHKGLNIALGTAWQEIQLEGQYAFEGHAPQYVPPPQRHRYRNWVPNLDAYFQFRRNFRLSTGYSYDISEPGINQLHPVPDLSNPLYRVQGNPNLNPERNHSANFNLRYWNPASFSSIHIGTRYNLYDNRIVYNLLTQYVDSVGYQTYSRPDNVSGGMNITNYMHSNFPLIKTKLTMNLRGSHSHDQAPVFINGIKNITTSNSWSGGTGLNYNVGSRLVLYLSGSLNLTDISFSINEDQNQEIVNMSTSGGIKWQFYKKFFFEGNYDFNRYYNSRLIDEQNINLLNASVRKIIGKSNRFELRLAAFDILNQQMHIRHSAWGNLVENTRTPTLARYYMLSVTYNIRGFDSRINRGRFW